MALEAEGCDQEYAYLVPVGGEGSKSAIFYREEETRGKSTVDPFDVVDRNYSFLEL